MLLVLDETLAPVFRIGDNRFILTYLMIVYVAFQWSWQLTIPAAFMIGLLRDFSGTGPIGIETSSLIVSAILLDFTVQKIERDQLVLRILSAMIFTFTVFLIHYLMAGFLTGINFNVWYYLTVAFGTSVYTGLLVPFFFFFSAKWFRDRTNIKQYDLFQ